ncbi:DUF4178 domain-containing protein [Flammeovirga aprica]|uniref:DUF4178 domain-containing protein n=1 Tax=Flammeovirga aprica JL-4 TaxID=694437 RepID=A0A7X9XA05_9BACT|nr:DUF4178 domain-containing protein [Flammeovirga aprica]NME69178.1 hypothetical protein [Flammeovirga aprica JL-4]
MSSNQVAIANNEKQLKLSFRWYKPGIYTYLFFSIIWNCFVILWVSALSRDFNGDVFDIASLLFPIGHVSVGISTFYYCLCNIFNRTIVKVDNKKLTVRHRPFPWLGQYTLDASEIEQLYIRKKTNSVEQDYVTQYPLMLKKKNGPSIELLSEKVVGNKFNAKNIERLIEERLNIQDYAMPGELDAENKPKKDELKRDRNKKINPTAVSLSDLKDEFVFNYDLSSWVVNSTIQYDWVSGNTDKLLRVVSDGGGNKLLYLQKQMSIITPWIESRVENFNYPTFDKSIVSRIPDTLEYDDEVYRLAKKAEGKLFRKDQKVGDNVSQSFYLNAEKNKSVRIVWLSDENYSIYLGDKKEERHFDNILHV